MKYISQDEKIIRKVRKLQIRCKVCNELFESLVPTDFMHIACKIQGREKNEHTFFSRHR